MNGRKGFNGVIGFLVVIAPLGSTLGDEVLHRYDADVLPYDVSAGWEIFDPCESPCSESLDNGHFVNSWTQAADLSNYTYIIARAPDAPPPTLWVEWRFRSNHPLGPTFFTCDGYFTVDYGGMHQLTFLYGDAVITGGGDFIAGLELDAFHTYRYESLDGVNFTIAVDGQVFIDRFDNTPSTVDFLQFGGRGGCLGDEFPNMINEWDHVWFGTISTGEQIIATNPPAGYLDPQVYANLERFTVTFDSPNYVYLDDITVEVTGGTAPTVMQTLRLDNGEPDVVEIVLDGPMPLGETTRFTFDTGQRSNVVEYTLATPPVIPAASEWGLLAMALIVLTTGTLILVRRILPPRWHS